MFSQYYSAVQRLRRVWRFQQKLYADGKNRFVKNGRKYGTICEVNMRKLFCAFLLAAMAVAGAGAENDGYNEWIKRREALTKDKSVVRYYTFEDLKDSKSIVKDLSPSGADLTFVPFKDVKTGEVFDDLQVIEGRWPEKKAVRLDRGWLQGKPADIANKQFTVEIWFRKNGPGSVRIPDGAQRGYIISSPAGWGAGWRVKTEYAPSPWLTFDIGIEKNNVRAKSDKMYADKIWHHLAATWDGREMKLYVDGAMVASAEYSGEYIPSKEFFKIGYRSGGSVLLDMDEVVIYNRALSAQEIEKAGKGFSSVSAEDVFSKADSYIRSGDYDNARAEYGKLKGLPSFGRELALFNIAETYMLEKNYAGAHRTFSEIYSIPGLTPYYRIYGLFREAQVYLEQKNYGGARELYRQAAGAKGASPHHVFRANLFIGDTYRDERKYSLAGQVYEKLLREEENSPFPNDGYRLNLCERLDSIDGLGDGAVFKSERQKRTERVKSPKHAIYVSLKGKDYNPGTKEKPFATIKRAKEEIRKIKEKGLPEGGITVYLRGGRYFISESILFGKDDSGNENAPVVYRSYSGEEARFIGGSQVSNFKLLTDPGTLKLLPPEARGKVWAADLKEAGITQYGKLLNRGAYADFIKNPGLPGALELIFNGKIMTLSRWPNDGWVRVAGLSDPDGEFRNTPYQKNKFIYSDERPGRWLEEKEVWIKGYLEGSKPYEVKHVRIKNIDAEKKSIETETVPGPSRWENTLFQPKSPYYAYNLLSEIDMPGEWYLDRETGMLYFYPPEPLENSEVILSTLDGPLVKLEGASNIIFHDLVLEGTWRSAVEILGGRNNLVAGSVIRNAGQFGVIMKDGWENGVVGCDIHDTGEGGILLDGGDRLKLIPSNHYADNNHIYRFNRFDGGYRPALKIRGIGQRVSHNLIHDGPHMAIRFESNDHIIEYNELYDAPSESREIGAINIYGEPWYLMNRGTVIRNNFFHHVSYHFSPNLTHGLNAIHIDAMNAGLVLTDNIFYRVPLGVSSTYPGNYLTDNLFVDVDGIGLVQGDRSNIFCKGQDIDAGPNYSIVNGLAVRLGSMRYKQPPWNYRYPPLVGMMEKEPAVWGKIQGSVIERNVNTGGRFISFGSGTRETTRFGDNWDGEKPFLVDKEHMDFRLRAGSPVYGLSGCNPLPFEETGLYEDELRATWPVTRGPVKYYKADWKPVEELKQTTMAALPRVSKSLGYRISRRTVPVTIDGKLDAKEWLGLDKSKAMVIKQYYTGEEKKGPPSYAWLLYDDEYLYIATMHDPDPYVENMPARLREFMPVIEIAVESQMGAHSQGWWMEDMPTGPIYVFDASVTDDFRVRSGDMFGMPHDRVVKLEAESEYKAVFLNKESISWTSEVKIPMKLIGINPREVDKLAFNIGTYKRSGWFAWVATGAHIWRVENAGVIEFAR